jgi:GT2 family glycosyltransferase
MNGEPLPDLSVIIVNWNTRELLLNCIESFFRTVKGLSSEIFVVDNGSSDGSTDSVRRAFPEIEIIQNERNLGFARANNEALRRSKGRYALLLNTDVVLTDGAVERLVAFMERNPSVGVAGGQLFNVDGSKQNSFDNFPSLATEALNKGLLRILFPRRYPSKRVNYGAPIEVQSVIGACMIVRSQAIREVGLLDEDYFFFLEETDWCYRMRRRRWQVCHVPQAKIIHLQGRTADLVKDRAKIEYYRSLYLFFKKHRGIAESVLLRVCLFSRLCVDFLLTLFSCLLTVFTRERFKRRLGIYGKLVYWHLRLCPEGMGLEEGRRGMETGGSPVV